MKLSDKKMWPNPKAAELLKTTLPLIQAPMAGDATTPKLVAAVSNAGGLGSLGAGYMTPNEMRVAIKKIRLLTNNSFAVNLFIPEEHYATDEQLERAKNRVQTSCDELNFNIPQIKPPYTPPFEEQMNVILEESVPIFTFTFGIPSHYWIELLKKNNIKLIGTATTLEEAKLLEDNDIDAIVAQGSEAGGHRGTFIGKPENALINTSSLISLLTKHIKIPIIATGGIMNAKNILESLKLGASAVQMGTAFLCCNESGIHPCYKKLLLNTSQDNTILTRAFSGKLARGIINKFIIRMQSHESEILDYPMQNALTTSMRKEAKKQKNTEFMSLWAGQTVYLCKELPASQLIERLNEEVVTLLKTQS